MTQGPWDRPSHDKPRGEQFFSGDREKKEPPVFRMPLGNGQFPEPKRMAAIFAGLLALLWLGSGFFLVQPDEQGVVQRFGKWVRTEEPGLHYHLPAPIEQVTTPKVTFENRIEIGFRTGAEETPGIAEESQMLTGDENILDANFVVLWRIADARKFLFNIRDPEYTIKKVSESAMREIMGRTEIQQALTDARQSIESSARDLIQAMLDSYDSGVMVNRVQLLRVDPPAPVVDAFNDVQRARSDRERLRNEAEAYRNDILPKAQGEAARLTQEAEGYRQQVVSRAQGDAGRFENVLSAYETSKEVTARRMYLETMQDVMERSRKVVMDGKAGQGVVPYLPLSELPAAKAQEGKAP